MLSWKCNNSLIGHLSGITFCLYVKLTNPFLYQLLVCWSSARLGSVVLDLEGFRCRKSNSIVEELAITTFDYSDFFIFLTPASFNSLPKSEQKAYQLIDK